VNAYFQFATGVSGWIYTGVALLMLMGGFRTLRKMSGGLRLLAGAWGVAAGLLMLPWTLAESFMSGWQRYDLGASVIAAVSLIGLTLTVLHKER